MASKVCELVENLVLPFAEQCGVELVEVDELSESDRGSGGFGSSGVK